MRLQRALARAGIASRRAAEDLIREAKVRVNGNVAQLGMSVDPDHDVIMVNGRRVTQARTAWIALNKPIGYVVTRRDPEGRDTVFQLLPDQPGLTYVGRLDVMTTGLLLLTNDGAAAHRLMHPRFQVERTYRVIVHGRSEAEIRTAFANGIVIDDRAVNVVTMKIRAAEESRGSYELLLVLAEGRYRIVRRICEILGLKVERLTRLSYGPISLGDLPPGSWRYLSDQEIAAINRGADRLVGGARKATEAASRREAVRRSAAGEGKKTGRPKPRTNNARPERGKTLGSSKRGKTLGSSKRGKALGSSKRGKALGARPRRPRGDW